MLDMKHKFQHGIDSDKNEPLYYPHKGYFSPGKLADRIA